MSDQKPRKRASYFSLGLLITVLLVSFWAVTNRQLLIDQVRAWQFVPSSSVATLRSDLELTGRGSFLFDASQPVLQMANEFNQSCQQKKETNNPIIGCYAKESIYIYDGTNSELDGIEETTAAHELLHAVYERLSHQDRERLDGELKTAYERVKTPELEKRMAYYEKAEPGQEMNELHSILGTENVNLGSALEAHYLKYFASRNRIVSYHDAYSGVFDRVTSQLTLLEEKINNDVASINDQIDTYNKQTQQLSDDTDDFNSRSQNGGFSSQSEFDQKRNQLVVRKDQLDAEAKSINNNINAVKRDRKTYNGLVDKYNQLSRSLNSSLSPTPSL